METEEVIVPETIEEATPEVAEPEVDWKLEALKAKEIAENQRIRAEKAEKRAKEREASPAVSSTSTLSSADLLAVTNARVHEDDIERLERFARSEGLSIKDALQSSEMKAVLDVREQQRKTAANTNMQTARAGYSAPSDEAILAAANAGRLPESDYEIERLIAARSRQR